MTATRTLLDDTPLDGPHATHVMVRITRRAYRLSSDSLIHFGQVAGDVLQFWGGAASLLIPSGHGRDLYAPLLLAGAVDKEVSDDFVTNRHPSRTSGLPDHRYLGLQWAPATLPYRKVAEHPVLSVVDLDRDDPWWSIYAVCLGQGRPDPDPELLIAANMLPELQLTDFLRVEHTNAQGSLGDLLARLTDRTLTPRKVSVINLAHGMDQRSSLTSGEQSFPESWFTSADAGPNILVVCSPDNVDDLALLWNLRAAWGEHYVTPLGIPGAQLTPENLDLLVAHEAMGGSLASRNSLYISSASLTTDALHELIPKLPSGTAIADPREILALGNGAGWPRQEVMEWHNGATTLVPVGSNLRRELDERNSSRVSLTMALSVLRDQFPQNVSLRTNHGSELHGGSVVMGVTTRGHTAVSVTWPSRWFRLKRATREHGIRPTVSTAGAAAALVLDGIKADFELTYLAHAPLLALLQRLAERQGMSWLRKRDRERGRSETDDGNVSPSSDDLVAQPVSYFRPAFGGQERPTKNWLLWAEISELIVKGFTLPCPRCHAQNWIPVRAFAPPIICHGCVHEIDRPFGDLPRAEFTYRLSERLRRLFEEDAIGHLLVLRYFSQLFSAPSGLMIGGHPGVDYRPRKGGDTIGEADVTLLLQDGSVIPWEVKSSASGVTDEQAEKLSVLASALGSPWQGIAICGYADDLTSDISVFERRRDDNVRTRAVLTYDRLLEPHVSWTLGSDPMSLMRVDSKARSDRERSFVELIGRWTPRNERDVWMRAEEWEELD